MSGVRSTAPASRAPLGRADEGFTLIELLVVLLVLTILLGIAIPVYLSVTGGAKKAAAQADLTDVLTAAAAYYASSGGFPAKSTTLQSALARTDPSIALYATTTRWTPSDVAGRNTVSVFVVTTRHTVIVSALDGDTVCWVAALNEGSSTAAGTAIPPGDSFFGATLATLQRSTTDSTAQVCTSIGFTTLAVTAWKPSFAAYASLS